MGAVSGVTSSSGSNAQSGAPQAAVDPLASKDTFLKLLVAQIKNQDPMNPSDGTQFVAQLAQFSELEQVMEIRSDIESIQAGIQKQPDSGTDYGAQTDD